MRTLLVLLFTVAPLVAAPVPKALKKRPADAERILGTWRMFDHAMDGGRQDSSDVCWRFEEGGRVFCVHTKTGQEFPMGYTIDPSGDPATMEWKDSPTGKTYPSIYKLDGDTLFLVSPVGGGPRPTEFAPAKGVYYTEFRREPTPSK